MLKICRSLHDKLTLVCQTLGLELEDVWQDLLFEIPDEELETFHNMVNPTDLELSPDLEALTENLAAAFGLTSLGMSVLMDKILDRTMKVKKTLADYETVSVA